MSVRSDRPDSDARHENRDEKGRWRPGYQPDNRCPQCGRARSKEAETPEMVRWYCDRCDRTHTVPKFRRF